MVSPKVIPFDTTGKLTTNDIVSRGWTRGWIPKLLGTPDATQKRHSYGIGDYVIYYYLASRVEKAEKTEKFSELRAKQAKRREASKKGVVTKEAKVKAYISSLVIEIPSYDKKELIDLACESYNDLQEFRENWSALPATPKSDPEFLSRICVNYLRHCESDYESVIYSLAGKVGGDSVITDLRRKVYQAITETYPYLKKECAKQFSLRCGPKDTPE